MVGKSERKVCKQWGRELGKSKREEGKKWVKGGN